MFKGLDQSLRKLSYKVLAGISKAADSVGKFALDVFRGFKIVVIKIHAALKAVLQVVRNQFERIASALARRKEKNESRGKFGKGETTWDQVVDRTLALLRFARFFRWQNGALTVYMMDASVLRYCCNTGVLDDSSRSHCTGSNAELLLP